MRRKEEADLRDYHGQSDDHRQICGNLFGGRGMPLSARCLWICQETQKRHGRISGYQREQTEKKAEGFQRYDRPTRNRPPGRRIVRGQDGEKETGKKR